MAKINVDVGVYLPSNPDGIVIDIDKKSGRPLQSHAKVSEIARFPSLWILIKTGSFHGDIQSSEGTSRNQHRSRFTYQRGWGRNWDSRRIRRLATGYIQSWRRLSPRCPCSPSYCHVQKYIHECRPHLIPLPIPSHCNSTWCMYMLPHDLQLN